MYLLFQNFSATEPDCLFVNACCTYIICGLGCTEKLFDALTHYGCCSSLKAKKKMCIEKLLNVLMLCGCCSSLRAKKGWWTADDNMGTF